MILLDIIWFDLLPLLVLIGAGWFLESRFRVGGETYGIMVSRAVLPCFIFYNLYRYMEAEYLCLLPAAAVLFLLLGVISLGISSLAGAERKAFCAASLFPDVGHIGAAVILLVYTQPPFMGSPDLPFEQEAVGAMLILLVFTEFLTQTAGVALAGGEEGFLKKSIFYALRMPSLYAVFLAWAVRSAGFSMEQTFLWPVLVHFNGAFIILIAVCTGVQLRRHASRDIFRPVWSTAAVRLLLSPLLALGILWVMPPVHPVLAQVFFLCSAVPASMTPFLRQEGNGDHPAWTVRAVLWNTFLGIFTIPAAVYAAHLLFPVTGG